jgi:hypothetical protein
MTWNYEGYKPLSLDLKKCEADIFDFIFLSEPWLCQIFLSPQVSSPLSIAAHWILMIKSTLIFLSPQNRAHAGVLVFWKKLHDPFVTIYDVNSSRFLVLLLNHPNLPTTIHITIYLLTLCSPLYQWRSSCYWKGKGRGENQKPVLDTPLRSSFSTPQTPPQATRPSSLPMQDPHTSYLEIF